jgi:hypothetical protein
VGWVEVTDSPPLHDCTLPSKEDVADRHAGRDSLWECDECRQRWRLYNLSRTGVSWSEESNDASGTFRVQLNR